MPQESGAQSGPSNRFGWAYVTRTHDMHPGPTPKSGEMVVRMGGPSSLEALAQQAAQAEKDLGIHGVSAFVRRPVGVRALEYGVVDVLTLRSAFPMHKTMGRGHFTVELPKPVTPEIADQFNTLFQWFNQGPGP